jgi:hypothetical protein
MPVKIPNPFRLTEANQKSKQYLGAAISTMLTDHLAGANGYFFIPREGKPQSMYYLCRLTTADGWHCLALNIPTEGRTPTWEEMHYVKGFFFDPTDVVLQFTDPEGGVYLRGNTYWLTLWVKEGGSYAELPPIFEGQKLQMKSAPAKSLRFFQKLYREVLNNLPWKNASTLKSASVTTGAKRTSNGL